MKPSIDSVKLYNIKNLVEENGSLSFLELPFFASRIFSVYGVRAGDIRGNHAHRECEQLLVCQSGKINVTCDDGERRIVYTLESPLQALHIPPMIWAEQYYHSENSILIGLASHPFEEEDYIRDYSTYKEAVSKS